jgi:hypothetical protein
LLKGVRDLRFSWDEYEEYGLLGSDSVELIDSQNISTYQTTWLHFQEVVNFLILKHNVLNCAD